MDPTPAPALPEGVSAPSRRFHEHVTARGFRLVRVTHEHLMYGRTGTRRFAIPKVLDDEHVDWMLERLEHYEREHGHLPPQAD